jgi:hypothetical protein
MHFEFGLGSRFNEVLMNENYKLDFKMKQNIYSVPRKITLLITIEAA